MEGENITTLKSVIQAEKSAGAAELALGGLNSKNLGCVHLNALVDAGAAVGAIGEDLRDAIQRVGGAADFRTAARAADAMAKTARMVAADSAELARALRAAGRR